MIQARLSYAETITLRTETCCNCGVVFAMPSDLYKALQQNAGKRFFCPNGHGMSYTESTESKLRKQMEREKAENERQQRSLQEKIIIEQREKEKFQKQLKRVEKGVCPCCNRTFTNLAKHFKTKHPELAKAAPQNAVHSKINKRKPKS